MAVIEYMLEKREATSHQRWVPDWVGDRGHWHNPLNYTYIGWDARSHYYNDEVIDYYYPDQVVVLSKEDLVQRQLAIHAVFPMTKPNPDNPSSPENRTTLTEAEVRSIVETWYDDFVLKNS